MPIVVNGSQSVDPDVDPDADQEIQYEWYCRQKNKETEIINFDAPESIDYPKASLADTSDFRGCFGTGYGKLKEDGMAIMI